jgi:hypothetical protein
MRLSNSRTRKECEIFAYTMNIDETFTDYKNAVKGKGFKGLQDSSVRQFYMQFDTVEMI